MEEARRAAEALASQCAAQSSLIATLKREVEAANENLTAQKLVVQRVEQKGAADIEVAQRDIEALHERIVELQLAGDAKEAGVVRLNTAIGELKARLGDGGAERAAAEAARLRALDGFCRMFIASRHLVRGCSRAPHLPALRAPPLALARVWAASFNATRRPLRARASPRSGVTLACSLAFARVRSQSAHVRVRGGAARLMRRRRRPSSGACRRSAGTRAAWR